VPRFCQLGGPRRGGRPEEAPSSWSITVALAASCNLHREGVGAPEPLVGRYLIRRHQTRAFGHWVRQPLRRVRLDADLGCVEIVDEDPAGNGIPLGRYLGACISVIIVLPRDVIVGAEPGCSELNGNAKAIDKALVFNDVVQGRGSGGGLRSRACSPRARSRDNHPALGSCSLSWCHTRF
jgi:hypothetical protein